MNENLALATGYWALGKWSIEEKAKAVWGSSYRDTSHQYKTKKIDVTLEDG